MGNGLSCEYIQYAVPVAEGPYADSTPVFRCAICPNELVKDLPGEKWDSPWDIFQYKIKDKGFREAEFIGSRHWDAETQESRTDKPPGVLRWMTYGQAETLAQAFARGLISLDLVGTVRFPNEVYERARVLRPVGVMSKNRPEWFVFEQCTCVSNMVLVPLYDSLGEPALLHILQQTQMNSMAVNNESAWYMLKLLEKVKGPNVTPELKDYELFLTTLILFDRPDDSLKAFAQGLNIKLAYWKDIVTRGETATDIELPTQHRDDVGTLCYTSGTTGAPKGVLITAGNFSSIVAAHQRCIMAHPGFRTTHLDIHISYLPLAHVFERLICANCIALGVRIACYSGDTQKLLDDMKVIKPTVFLSVPRLYMRINDKVFAGIQDKSTVAQFLFKTAVDAKIKLLREKGVYHHPVWDSLVFNKTRKLMGGNVKFMLVGGAPLESIVQERMSVLFCCPLMHGFGMTEMGASFICNPGDRIAGHIGGVQPMLEFCLRSIPEMNYVVDGEEPCGELLVRGHSVTPGYLMNPDATKATITEDGWLSSGDVAVLLPGNSIKIIDRKKNIFKLAQGEYVAPERMEAIYTRAVLVGQIFVHGESTKAALVGVVVPDEEMVVRWTQQRERPFSSLAEVCQDDDFKRAVMEDMETAGREGGLKGFEKVKEIFLEPEPFTIDNNLLTPTLKLRRHEGKLRYAAQIEMMYKKLGM